MIPRHPGGTLERDSLASVTAKARWLYAYLHLQWCRYRHEHYGAARLVVGVLLLIVLAPIAYKLDGFLAGWYVPTAARHAPDLNVAWVQFIWYLVVLIVAMVVAYAMAPKPQQPERAKSRVPEADDGKSIIRAYGTIWVEDPMVLGFKTMGEDPIQKKGGK